METEDVSGVTLAETAARLLSQEFGGRVTLGEPENLREKYRNRVVRCAVIDGPAGLPASIIAKAAVGDGDQAFDANADERDSPSWRFTNEWAGNRFLNERRPDLSLNARVLAGERATGTFILEDLGNGNCLADVIQAGDPDAAKAALFAYARALGNMHAATTGHREDWLRARSDAGGTEKDREPDGIRWLNGSLRDVRALYDELSIPLPAGFDAEARAVARTMDDPGPYGAFSPNDTCPDNHRLMPDDTLRFFDFEYAGYRHALLDAAYLRVPFPTCWCVNRLPADLVPELEGAYRTALISGCPEAADDASFSAAMTHACAYWTVVTLGWQLKRSLEEDGEWGISSVRQRHLYRLETFADTATRSGHLPAMVTAANALRARLVALWQPPLEDMPLYPAFRPA